MATPISNTVISLTAIDGTDCLGDSRAVINNNTSTIGQSISSLTLNTTTLSTAITDLNLLVATNTTNINTLSTATVTSLSTNGYQIMLGGLIMQWGESSSLGPDSNQTLTFPIPFPTTCLKAFVSIRNTSTTNDDVFARVLSYNSTQITVRGEAVGGGPWPGTRFIDYLAIGY